MLKCEEMNGVPGSSLRPGFAPATDSSLARTILRALASRRLPASPMEEATRQPGTATRYSAPTCAATRLRRAEAARRFGEPPGEWLAVTVRRASPSQPSQSTHTRSYSHWYSQGVGLWHVCAYVSRQRLSVKAPSAAPPCTTFNPRIVGSSPTGLAVPDDHRVDYIARSRGPLTRKRSRGAR